MPLPIPAPRESGYTSTTAHPLYWVSYGPSAPETPKLLILHGGPGADHEYLLPQMLHLAERYNCYFYDQRGGGKSRTDSNVEVTWRTHVEDLAMLARELGIDPLSIVGYSWGAMLALLYSMHLRDNPGSDYPKPRRLVLINPGPLSKAFRGQFDANMSARGNTPQVRASREKLQASGLRESDPEAYKQRAFELSVTGYFARPEMARELTPFRVIGRVQQGVWNSLGDYDLVKHLSPLGIPALIVHGIEDPIPVESSKSAAEALQAEFALIPNSGHVPYVEEPEKLWGVVDPFLAKTD